MELSKAEAAEYLGISTRALERYTQQGKLGVKYVRATRGKQARYQEGELAALKAELETETHKPVVSAQTPTTQLTGLTDTPVGVSELVEKFLLPLSAHLSELTKAVTDLQQPSSAAGRPPVPVEEKLLLTLQEVQSLTGLSREILREAIDTGELPAKIIGRAWRVKREDLEAYIDEL